MVKYVFTFGDIEGFVEVLKIIPLKTKNKVMFRVVSESYGEVTGEYHIKKKPSHSGSRKRSGNWKFEFDFSGCSLDSDNLKFDFIDAFKSQITDFLKSQISEAYGNGTSDTC